MTTLTERTAAPCLHSLDEVRGYALEATDGEIGRVRDVLFDARNWNVPYVVAGTRALFGREVLLYTGALGTPDRDAKTIPAKLSKETIRNAPGVEVEPFDCIAEN